MNTTVYAIPILALVSLAACNRAASGPAEASAPAAPSDPMEIKADPRLLARIRTALVGAEEVGGSITVAGRVATDDTRATRIGTPVMSRISALSAREGDEVKRGQLLALLISTGLSEAQLGFLKAFSQKQLAQGALDRANILMKADVIGSAELQRRDAELAGASAESDAARDQLQLLGMAPESIDELRRTRTMNSLSRVVASMDGTVMDRKVNIGQVVQPADTIYEIADLSHVWLVADVPEQNAGNLSAGQPAEARIEALPGHVIDGTLAFVSPTVNPETRTIMVRMNLPNPDRRFKPAMLATMVLREHTQKRLVVPASAVVREGNEECLLIERAPGMFRLQPVKLGAEVGGRRILLEGAGLSERIVVDGAFHLNNERRRRAVRGGEGG